MRSNMAYMKSEFRLERVIDPYTTKRIECYQFDEVEINKIYYEDNIDHIRVKMVTKDGREFWRNLDEVIFTKAEHDKIVADITNKKLSEKFAVLK